MGSETFSAIGGFDEARPTGLSRLSERERAVIGLAIDGRTDEQIARALDLSVSTVNSYWVRIRGKIGPVSRVQITTLVLRERFQEEREVLTEEIARLGRELRKRDAEIARLREDLGQEA